MERVAADWLAAEPGAAVTSVQTESRTFHIAVRIPAGPAAGSVTPASRFASRPSGWPTAQGA